MQSAVDLNRLTRDVRVAHDHQNGLRNFLGLAHSSNWNSLDGLSGERTGHVRFNQEGDTAFTVMPWAANRAAYPRVSPSMPAFDAL